MANDQMVQVAHGRRGRRRQNGVSAPALVQRPFRRLALPYPPVTLISEDQVEYIHQASLKLLSETGLDVLHQGARAIMKKAGADVREGEPRVRFDPALIVEVIATVPSEFTLHARNPRHTVTMGGNSVVFNMMASAPNCSDTDQGRRAGNREDYRNFLRLAQMHNVLHVTGGYPVEPVDIHASIRHLDCIQDYITLTDKAYCIYSLGEERVSDAMEMTRIAHGLTREELRDRACVFSIINTNSPLQLDIPMMQGVMAMAEMGQPVVITPFTLAGAMAPITIAGAVTLQNAEALAAVSLSQMVQPGAPVVYGGFTSNVDMKTGSPAFGTPEYMKAQHIGGQLARRYGIPYRSSNVCAANTVDAQAAYEAVFSLWGAINGGANMLMHGAGWLEGGLCCSYEKIMLDIDLLQMVSEFLQPVSTGRDDLALDAINEVGPAGHFFGTDHTQARYRDAFYSPILSDWRNFETWSEAGSPIAIERANAEWKNRLAAYEAPPLDPAIREELDAFVTRRKAEGGAATDF
ncbi:trimethylamine methyltransferase family protein [Amaricoccus tamworthensis]|uniref:trimethylamine methyltransferase family protein n=1 Tax=Amaricoccus tamworthensis TaxID=57002 RepID=UPI003C7CF216